LRDDLSDTHRWTQSDHATLSRPEKGSQCGVDDARIVNELRERQEARFTDLNEVTTILLREAPEHRQQSGVGSTHAISWSKHRIALPKDAVAVVRIGLRFEGLGRDDNTRLVITHE
jgi:hypothetical protein